MATKRAKTITAKDLEWVHRIIEQGEHPVANRLKMDLSFYAGLRACEIARLTTDAFLDPNGEICKNLAIFSHVAKKGRERTIPIHPELRKSIKAFLRQYPDIDYIAVGRKPGPQRISAVTVWFHNIYKKAGLKGCSSHSGRRTFITDLSKRVGFYNGSLRDVQQLAGHARLETTERYIEPSTNTAKLVASIGNTEFDEARQATEALRRRGRPRLSDRDLIERL